MSNTFVFRKGEAIPLNIVHFRTSAGVEIPIRAGADLVVTLDGQNAQTILDASNNPPETHGGVIYIDLTGIVDEQLTPNSPKIGGATELKIIGWGRGCEITRVTNLSSNLCAIDAAFRKTLPWSIHNRNTDPEGGA